MTHLLTLQERARYLGARIQAKRLVGWEYQYDERERDALLWAINRLEDHDARDMGFAKKGSSDPQGERHAEKTA